MSPARIWLRDSPQARILTRLPYGARPVRPCSAGRNHWPLVTTPGRDARKQVRRCGGALACASPGRPVSQSLVPHGLLAVDAHGRTLPHAGSAQSAPRNLRGRCRRCLDDGRIELAAAPRHPRVPEHGHHQQSPRTTLRAASAALQALAGCGRAVSARAAAPSVRPCHRSEPSSTYVE